MGFSYVSIEDAIAADGLRMVVVGNIPSPWGEAAKGILHVKGIEWKAVRLAYDSDALKEWSGGRNGPIAVYGKEPPRSRWDDILLLAERLAPEPSLLPMDAADRALVFGLCHDICGEDGLAWSRRNQLVHLGMAGQGGFETRVARYLGRKYGYRPEMAETTTMRVSALVAMLADRLKAQVGAGSGYLVGDRLTAADIHCATAMAMFRPLPPEACAMDEAMRVAFSFIDPATEAAFDPILFEHRDRIYERHLALPLSL